MDEKSCLATTGSGLITYFKFHDKDQRGNLYFIPDFERRPSGNLLQYRGQTATQTTVLKTCSPDEKIRFGWVSITPKETYTDAKASDGKTAKYTFEYYNTPSKARRYYLKEASFSHKPTQTYEYEHPELTGPVLHPPIPLLKTKKLPEGRFQSVKYYKLGHNNIDKIGTIDLPQSDFRINRVRALLAPGPDNTPLITHRFVYRRDLDKKGELLKGTTEVYDAKLNKTAYSYNKEHRPTAVTRYQKDVEEEEEEEEQVYSAEKFVWDEGEKKEHKRKSIDPYKLIPSLSNLSRGETSSFLDKMPESYKDLYQESQTSKEHNQIGNLLGKYTEDAQGNIQHALFFDYDPKGNIEEEHFYGNLTGTCTIPIKLNAEQQPKNNHVECYTKRFAYTKDTFNLLQLEAEDNGKIILYAYKPETDLVTAKYLFDGSYLKFRQFFFYDDNGSLEHIMKDDGNSLDCNDLSTVTERRITSFILRKERPIGLPEEITETYYEPNNKEQVQLLKRIKCKYDQEGHLLEQEHYDANKHYCYTLIWEYDAHGNVTKEINALGHEITKTYDANDNLKTVKGPRPEDITEYFYDHANRITKTEKRVDGNCFATHYEYDLKGNCIKTIDRFLQETTYEYDEFDRLIETKQPSIFYHENGDKAAVITTVEYDCNNRPVAITQPGGWKTQVNYNARGKPITKTHPDKTVEQFLYNLDGTLEKSIAPNGTQIRYTRDFLGRVLVEETLDPQYKPLSRQTFTYKGSKLIAKTDAEKCESTYTYDRAGRLTAETCGDSLTTYAYDPLNRIEKITRYFGYKPDEVSIQAFTEVSIQAFTYDFLDQVKEERLEDNTGKVLQRISYEYDLLGNRTHTLRTTEDGESLTVAAYNGQSQPIAICDPEGHITHYSYDYAHLNDHDQLVLKITITDPHGKNTHQIHDVYGRLHQVITQDPFGFQVAKQEIFYDVMGRCIKTIDTVMDNGEEKRKYVNTWSYHASGQEELFVEGADSPEQKITKTIYNTLSQKEVLIKPDGQEIYHTYDAFGRLKTITSQDASIACSYTYNNRHQVIEVKDGNDQQVNACSYDTTGRLKREVLGNGLVIAYDYDRLGRVKELSLHDGSTVKYLYDAAYLKEVQRYKNDKLLYQHRNELHDQTGALLQSTLIGNAGTLQYTYDLLGRCKQIKNPHWSQEVPHAGFDAIGRLVAMTVKDAAGAIPYQFEYDPLDHLKKEEGHVSNTYHTDSLHNRLEKNKISYEINALNQLKKQGNCEYDYPNGNLTQKKQGDLTTTYTYDAFNRLTSVRSPEEIETTYQYDSFNRRLSKTHNGLTTRYLYQGQNEIGSVNDKNEIEELRILGAGTKAEMGAAVALELYGKTYAPIHDRQGHLVCLLDAKTGQPAETYRYSAFGEETILNAQGQPIADSQVGNPWRFACKRVDPETGWIYFGQRYYDPEIGRWTTPDPAGFVDGPNLYAYLHHNPLMAFDAYGLESEAYRESCEVGRNAPNYANFSISDRQEPTFFSADSERAGYISSGSHHRAAGFFHGCIDFFSNQWCDFNSFACLVGSNEWDDPLERLSFNAAFSDWQTTQRNAFDDWVIDGLGVDPNNHAYQSYRTYTTLGIEIGFLAWGGYGLAKGGFRAIKSSRWFLPKEGSKIASQIARQELKEILIQESKIADKLTGHTYHGLNQAIGRNNGRGVNAKAMLQALKSPERIIPQADGAIKYVGEKATVILNSEGKIITTYGQSRGPQIWYSSGVVQS